MIFLFKLLLDSFLFHFLLILPSGHIFSFQLLRQISCGLFFIESFQVRSWLGFIEEEKAAAAEGSRRRRRRLSRQGLEKNLKPLTKNRFRRPIFKPDICPLALSFRSRDPIHLELGWVGRVLELQNRGRLSHVATPETVDSQLRSSDVGNCPIRFYDFIIF